MQLLLDTHILLWWLQNSSKLPPHSRARIATASGIFVSSVSIWEIAIKVQAGKLNVDLSQLTRKISSVGFVELRISHRHAAKVASLPSIHRDPFDRLLVAQSMCETLKLMTADRVLADYSDLVEIV